MIKRKKISLTLTDWKTALQTRGRTGLAHIIAEIKEHIRAGLGTRRSDMLKIEAE